MSLLIPIAAETSKVPFYICGGLLAVWAVVLGFIGIQRPEFPGSVRGQRGVILITLVFVALAIGTAIGTG
ncbi:MAG TPA: hypothetical protein VHX62_18965 [Solirubrobacteraceae bacterium]|jgi:hypothetical protein|nr:hypothetical protein [Solirubrobacteraceae bacterium]